MTDAVRESSWAFRCDHERQKCAGSDSIRQNGFDKPGSLQLEWRDVLHTHTIVRIDGTSNRRHACEILIGAWIARV